MGDQLGKYILMPCLIDQSEDPDLSEEVKILGYQIIGVIVPTGWTAADVTFYIDPGDGTFRLVSDLTLTTPTANQITLLNTGSVAPYFVPILAGVAAKVASSVSQTADREVLLLLQALP